MKVSYSKMILSGVIATAFFMVSCQKKGTATGVKTTAAAPSAEKPADENKETPDEGRKQVTPISLTPAGIKSADTTIKSDLPNVRGGKLANSSSSDTSKVSSSDTTTSSVKKIEVKKTETKKEEVKKTEIAESKYCSDEVINALRDVIFKYKTVLTTIVDEKIEAAKKITALNANIKACEAFEATLVKAKVESCLVKTHKDDLTITASFLNQNCDYVGVKVKELSGQQNKYATRVEKEAKAILTSLKAEKLVVSEDAKPLFEKENQTWKMFLVDGAVQSDAIKLEDAVKAEKVACTITATPEKYSDAVKVTLQVTGVATYVAKNKSDFIKSGVDINVSVKTEIADEKSAETVKAVLSCTNLNAKKVDIKKLKAALGSHIAIEVVKEDANEEAATEKVNLD